MTTYPVTPVELAKELGHEPESRPGRRVRAFLRARYPDHVKNERWELNEEQANDVRAFFAGDAEDVTLEEKLRYLDEALDPRMEVTRELLKALGGVMSADGRDGEANIEDVIGAILKAVVQLETRLVHDSEMELPKVPIRVFGKTYLFAPSGY